MMLDPADVDWKAAPDGVLWSAANDGVEEAKAEQARRQAGGKQRVSMNDVIRRAAGVLGPDD